MIHGNAWDTRLKVPRQRYAEGGASHDFAPPIILVTSWIVELWDDQDIRTRVWMVSRAQKRVSWAQRAL